MSRDCESSTKENYRVLLGSMEEWMGKPLAQATVEDVTKLAEKLESMRSGHQYANVLRSFYRAVNKEDERLEYLWVDKKEHKLRPDEIMEPRDVEALVYQCDSMRDAAYLGCLWDSGGRDAEILAAHRKDLGRLQSNGNGPREFVLWLGTMKEPGTEHEVRICDSYNQMRTWWDNYYPPSDSLDTPLFPSYNGRFMTSTDGWRMVKRIADRAKRAGTIREDLHISPHGFRHAKAAYLQRMGTPTAEANKMMGWKEGSTQYERTYGHLRPSDAYRNLRRKEGYDIPADEEPRPPKLVSREGILPMTPPPAQRAAGLEALQAKIDEAVSRAVSGVLEQLRDKLVQDTMQKVEFGVPEPSVEERLEFLKAKANPKTRRAAYDKEIKRITDAGEKAKEAGEGEGARGE